MLVLYNVLLYFLFFDFPLVYECPFSPMLGNPHSQYQALLGRARNATECADWVSQWETWDVPKQHYNGAAFDVNNNECFSLVNILKVDLEPVKFQICIFNCKYLNV